MIQLFDNHPVDVFFFSFFEIKTSAFDGPLKIFSQTVRPWAVEDRVEHLKRRHINHVH